MVDQECSIYDDAPQYWSDPKLTEELALIGHQTEETLEPFRRAEQFSQLGGIILETKETKGHNGDQPKRQPYHWLCGIDPRSGAAVDPPSIIAERDHPLHFVHSDNRLHGALSEHPLVADASDWALPAWAEARKEAIKGAKSADETKIPESDAVPVGTAAV